MTPHVNPLAGEIEAFVFDVFGTVVDWLGPVSREIHRRATNHQVEMSEGRKCSALSFAQECNIFIFVQRHLILQSSGGMGIRRKHFVVLRRMRRDRGMWIY